MVSTFLRCAHRSELFFLCLVISIGCFCWTPIAKALIAAKYRVLTVDDVVNKAYGISGAENIIQGGWVTEKDLQEVENLLQARTGLSAYAVQVGKSAKADIVVSGTVRYQT